MLYNGQVLDKNNATELAERLRTAIGDFVRDVRGHDTLPANQAAALGYLDRDGPLPITEIARRQQVRHQSIARTVKLLESQALVEFRQDAADRRQVIVHITEAGRALLNQQRELRADAIAGAIENRLTPHEREVIAEIPAILLKLTSQG